MKRTLGKKRNWSPDICLLWLFFCSRSPSFVRNCQSCTSRTPIDLHLGGDKNYWPVDAVGPSQNDERKTDSLGGWCTNNFTNWGTCRRTKENFELKNVLVLVDRNLTNPQKKLLLWHHHKLGVSIQHIQHLMTVTTIVGPCGRETVVPK